MVNKVVKKGVSHEEENFFKANQELIAQRRTAFASERELKTLEDAKHLHWMKCPKCGQSMQEQKLNDVDVDKCLACGGVYLDSGELEFLMGREPEGRFTSLRDFFH